MSLAQFTDAFAGSWSSMSARFLKLECWQQYRETATNSSQAAYERGDLETTRDLLEREAEADRALYEEAHRRNIEYARIRLLQEPLSQYLEYELLSYRIRSDLGEIIEVVRCAPDLELPNDEYFDFLLFDRQAALIHDYGKQGVGRQTGGWITRDPVVIGGLEATAMSLRRTAEPLEKYLASI